MGTQQSTPHLSRIVWIDPNIGTQLQLTKPANQLRYKFTSHLVIMNTVQQAVSYCHKLKSNLGQHNYKQPERVLVVCSSRYIKSIHNQFKYVQNACPRFVIFCETKSIAQMYMSNHSYKQFQFAWEFDQIDNCVQSVQKYYPEQAKENKRLDKGIIEKRKLIKKQKRLDTHLKQLKNKVKGQCSQQKTATSSPSIPSSSKQDQQINRHISQFKTEQLQKSEGLRYFSEIVWLNDNPNYIQQQSNLLKCYGSQFNIFNKPQQAICYYHQHGVDEKLLIICCSSLVEVIWEYIPKPVPYGSSTSTPCLIFGENDEKSKLVLQKYPEISFPCFWSVQDIVLMVKKLEQNAINGNVKTQRNHQSNHKINSPCQNQCIPKISQKYIQTDTQVQTPQKSATIQQQKVFNIIWVVKNKESKRNMPYHFLEKLFKQGLQIDIKDLEQFSTYLQQKLIQISQLSSEDQINLVKNTKILAVVSEVLDLKEVSFLCERIGEFKVIMCCQKQIKQGLLARGSNSIEQWLKNPILERIKNQFNQTSPIIKASNYEELHNKILMQLTK